MRLSQFHLVASLVFCFICTPKMKAMSVIDIEIRNKNISNSEYVFVCVNSQSKNYSVGQAFSIIESLFRIIQINALFYSVSLSGYKHF